ncbi:MAG: hypothetical protein ACH0QD_07365 [Tepidibacillus sp.]
MDAKTISNLAELVHDNWNNKFPKEDIKKRINGLLHRKKTSNVVKEYKDLLNTMPKEKKKQIPIMTVILVLALCRRNLDEEEMIYEALKENGLVTALYGGLAILLNGTSKQLSINIEWQDESFQNKYEFINRFQGEFLYWEYIEIFIAASIVQKDNESIFERLVIKDRSRLLLLNIASGRLRGRVSDELILTLINKQDELDQNIGFFLLTAKLNRYMWEIEQYLRKKEMGIQGSKSKKRTSDKQILHELNRIKGLLNHCSDSVKVSLLLNYMLSKGPVIPKAFTAWLLDPQLQSELIKEIKYSNKIKTLDKVYLLIDIVSNTRRRINSKEFPKIELYNALVDVIISFIKDRKGIYQWTDKEKQIMEEITKLLPRKSKKRLLSFLNKETDNIMSLRLDELVRFNIYLKDKSKQDIITGMNSIAKENLAIGSSFNHSHMGYDS